MTDQPVAWIRTYELSPVDGFEMEPRRTLCGEARVYSLTDVVSIEKPDSPHWVIELQNEGGEQHPTLALSVVSGWRPIEDDDDPILVTGVCCTEDASGAGPRVFWSPSYFSETLHSDGLVAKIERPGKEPVYRATQRGAYELLKHFSKAQRSAILRH